jgi:hypothetical protein
MAKLIGSNAISQSIREDVKLSSGETAYGWQKCGELGGRGSQQQKRDDALMNADSWAWLATGNPL